MWNDFKTENIKDAYKFEMILGEGAFGKVIKARNLESNDTVAIKAIGKDNLDAEDVNNLMTEITVLDKIDHPNIVKMIEAYENDKNYYIILELMDGGELFDRIVENECYSEKLAANTFRPIVDAIKYCHELGIVHRDLKPENLLYVSEDANSIIKITDFGLAKVLQSNTQMMSTVCGTPSYLAPEILKGEKYNTQCDIWSLGVILYTLLCGYPPFSEDDNAKLMEAIKSGKVGFPSEDWSHISDDAKDLIMRCLKVTTSERLDCEGILKHKWMLHECDTKHLGGATANLKKFQAKKKLKKAQQVVYFSKLMENALKKK